MDSPHVSLPLVALAIGLTGTFLNAHEPEHKAGKFGSKKPASRLEK